MSQRPKGISIGSAVFVQLTGTCRQTDTQTTLCATAMKTTSKTLHSVQALVSVRPQQHIDGATTQCLCV